MAAREPDAGEPRASAAAGQPAALRATPPGAPPLRSHRSSPLIRWGNISPRAPIHVDGSPSSSLGGARMSTVRHTGAWLAAAACLALFFASCNETTPQRTGFTVTALVSDTTSYGAQRIDPHLKN